MIFSVKAKMNKIYTFLLLFVALSLHSDPLLNLQGKMNENGIWYSSDAFGNSKEVAVLSQSYEWAVFVLIDNNKETRTLYKNNTLEKVWRRTYSPDKLLLYETLEIRGLLKEEKQYNSFTGFIEMERYFEDDGGIIELNFLFGC
jgi:hypothetical protein